MIKKHVVSRDESVYEAWPDLELTKSGKLICVFSECTAHIDRTNSRITICESCDKGRTWSEKKYLTPKMKKDDYYNCARISVIDEKIVVIADRIRGWDTDGHAEQYVWISEDDGNTWSEPIVLPLCGICPDKLRKLKNGRLIIAAQHKSTETCKLEQYLWYSDDNGKNWSDRVTVAADEKYNFCEACIYECEDETLVAFIREQSALGICGFKAISHDSGESWSRVYDLSIPGSCHRPTAGKLNDGRVMVTFRNFNGFAQTNCNTNIALYNTGEEAVKAIARADQECRIIPLDYDRNAHPDCGYTGWVQFDDGEIYVVNYIKDDSDKAQIRGYSFYPHDIILGE